MGVSYDRTVIDQRSKAIVLRLNSDTFPQTEEERHELYAAGLDVRSREALGPADLETLLPAISTLLVVSAKIPAQVMERLENCRIISRYGSGTDNIDVAAATRHGILVTNVPEFCLSEVADHTMALLLGTARKLLIMDRHTRTGQWQARVRVPVRRIAGRVLGLVGFGRIGQEVARRARSFDLHVIAFDPRFNTKIGGALQVESVGLEHLLRASDFVSLHVPLTDETLHLIAEAQLRSMKAGAILINTARGGVVDEQALLRALEEHWIAGAGIDVYESLEMFGPKPGRTDHPFFHLENVLLTPHSASCSEESLEELMREGARQAVAVLRGEWPAHCVNPAVVPRIALAAATSV